MLVSKTQEIKTDLLHSFLYGYICICIYMCVRKREKWTLFKHTSAALAAAEAGVCASLDGDGAVLSPNVRPGPVTFGDGAAAGRGAWAGEAPPPAAAPPPIVRPSPWKFALELDLPKQLPIL